MNFIDRYLKSKLVGHIGYDVWRPNEKKKYLRYIPNDVKTILDIGCGLGEFLWILQKNGYEIGRKRIRKIYELLGLEAVYPKPKMSKKNKEHIIYPYLLRDVEIVRCNHGVQI